MVIRRLLAVLTDGGCHNFSEVEEFGAEILWDLSRIFGSTPVDQIIGQIRRPEGRYGNPRHPIHRMATRYAEWRWLESHPASA